jgi:hypothetical protein
MTTEAAVAGQGATTKRAAATLRDSGWQVVYTCVPNTPHLGVVPISTRTGVTAQRYPDILSTHGNVIRLSEVEMSLTEDVATKAIERFGEQRSALSTPEVYADLRSRVLELTGIELPKTPTVVCELVICAKLDNRNRGMVAELDRHGILVVAASHYKA